MSSPDPSHVPQDIASRCPLCEDEGLPRPCPQGGSHCPRCGSVLWPDPVTRPRPEVERYFAGPGPSPEIPLEGSLCGLVAELARIKRTIEDQQRQASGLAGWLASLLERWHRLIARNTRPSRSGASGVSDRWID
jgi:hypothetical protein